MKIQEVYNTIDALHTRVIDEMDEDPQICDILERAIEDLDDLIIEREVTR
jgi:hypothetical protein